MIGLAGIVVAASGLWLLGLAAAVIVFPGRTERFLKAFASSARTHYLEQALRLVAGVALVLYASEMRFAELFAVFGWLISATAVGLLLIPWRWHNRFGKWAIPLVTGHMTWFAFGAFGIGALILYGML